MLEDKIKIKTSHEWTKGVEFDYEFSIFNSTNPFFNEEFQLKIIENDVLIEYSEVIYFTIENFEVNVRRRQPGEVDSKFVYPIQMTEGRITRTPAHFSGISGATAEAISSASKNIQEYGDLVGVAVPGFATLIVLLNVKSLIPLLPTKYSLKYRRLLELLVHYSEEDILAKVFTSQDYIYSKDYKISKVFIPVNHTFQF